jgi:DNA-damage-inducible protein D
MSQARRPAISDPIENTTASPSETPFEAIRRVDSDGTEFWSARDLMQVLEYTDWRNFKGVLIKGQFQ